MNWKPTEWTSGKYVIWSNRDGTYTLRYASETIGRQLPSLAEAQAAAEEHARKKAPRLAFRW